MGQACENLVFYGIQPPREEENSDGIWIEDLSFSKLTYNCLKKANVHTLDDLRNCSADDLLDIRNLGKECLVEICRGLNEFGQPLPAGVERYIKHTNL